MMTLNEINAKERIFISDELSIINARHIILTHIKAMNFTSLDQTKIITASSELLRNIINYAKKGIVYIEHVTKPSAAGLKLIFKDQGSGIKDINTAMKDNYSTSGGMGLGLPGSKRLMDEFHISSEVGIGTTVTIVKWAK